MKLFSLLGIGLSLIALTSCAVYDDYAPRPPVTVISHHQPAPPSSGAHYGPPSASGGAYTPSAAPTPPVSVTTESESGGYYGN
ncbi:MAG: hypothetical protein ACYCQI_08190 [Gammaproteobacteria bacterium]